MKKNNLEENNLTNKIREEKIVTIIDYGAGNLKSIENALKKIGVRQKISSDPEEIIRSDALIFPGVGSFGYMMRQIKEKRIDKAIIDSIIRGKPFLGICLGMQALFEFSDESRNVAGLGIFKGKSVKFTKGKIPQIGWNNIVPVSYDKSNQVSDLSMINDKGYAYFVNSFHVIPENKKIISAESDYYGRFICAISWKNIGAVQFHPEKSGDYGIRILERWCRCLQKE